MTYRVFFCLFILGLGIIGCLTKTAEKAVEVETAPEAPAKPPTIAELHLSLAKEVYSADEPIPLQMTFRAGKFDLLVPAASVEGEGAFGGLIITDAAGKGVERTSPISWAPHMKNLLHDGKAVDCIHGMELESGAETVAALEDLRTHYNLAPGGLHAPSLHGFKGLSGVSAGSITAGCSAAEGPLGDSAEQA